MDNPAIKQGAPVVLSARLVPHVSLERNSGGEVAATLPGQAVRLGKLSSEAFERAQRLGDGLDLAALERGESDDDKKIELLARRLAAHGLLEYRLHRVDGGDLAVIEPQLPSYWPEFAALQESDRLALSRFAYLRRRSGELVLESPRADALFRIVEPSVASFLARLVAAQSVAELRQAPDFPGVELLALLAACGIVFKTQGGNPGLRLSEGGESLALWDFHDLLFHARSTEGRHANLLGGVYPFTGKIAPAPALRPSWPGEKIDLQPRARRAPEPSPLGRLLRARHSVREFDREKPITFDELALFLDGTARVLSSVKGGEESVTGDEALDHTTRPYPSAGASYELELYLAVDQCEGLAKGLYHYDAGAHGLVAIEAEPNRVEATLIGAAFAMNAQTLPQVLIIIAARFGRVTWKYSSLAYSLILKDVGVLTQSFYLTATEMGLGGCAIGAFNIDLFEKMTGLPFHVEGPVGEFALGRPGAAGIASG